MDYLVAVDGSESSERALEHAVEMAHQTGGTVTAVHAVDPQVYSTGGIEPVSDLSDADRRLLIEDIEDTERRGQETLDRVVERVGESSVSVRTELLYGDPVVAVAEFAEQGEFDGIVVGHRGLSERSERVLGSVSKALVERATVPVTVVE